jgi:hypothetical protein
MNATVKHIETSTTLIRALEKAAAKKTTPDEIQAQRVSFVMGSLKSDSTITREQVIEVIKKEGGKE